MSSADQFAISVVISTFERPDACERALMSVLGQNHPPLEVLICDNGSTDSTGIRCREWERRYKQVRYLRIARNTRTPATTRNLGIESARGAWIAFLDDDDAWLPQKLERQYEVIARDGADLVATNAYRSDGEVYFPDAPAVMTPTRSDLLRANRIIVSSALVKRAFAGFPTARWMRGVADYASWLDMADRGARQVVLGEPLVYYHDAGRDRMSAARGRQELAAARLSWRRALRSPLDLANARAAFNYTAGAIRVVGADAAGGLRSRAARR